MSPSGKSRKKYTYINSQYMVTGGRGGTPHGGQDWFPGPDGGRDSWRLRLGGGARRGLGLGVQRLSSNRV